MSRQHESLTFRGEVDLPPRFMSLFERLVVAVEAMASGPAEPPLEPWSPERVALLERLAGLKETQEGITQAVNDLPGPALPQVDVTRKLLLFNALGTPNRRNTLKDAITEERDHVIVLHYPTTMSTGAILAMVNQLPGPAFTRNFLYQRSAQLNVMRPGAAAPPAAPVGQEAFLP